MRTRFDDLPSSSKAEAFALRESLAKAATEVPERLEDVIRKAHRSDLIEADSGAQRQQQERREYLKKIGAIGAHSTRRRRR
jgi:hypothetical protein